jgi:hypothetical protein
MLTVVHINGPINSGKSTFGLALSKLLPDALFIDGDDHDAPAEAALDVRIEAALRRMETHIASAAGGYLVVAYPLEWESYERLKAAAKRRGGRFLVLTLAPSLEVALSDRGMRALSSAERTRIVEMYEEGYHSRAFSDLTLDTSQLSIGEAAEKACAMILAETV